MRQRLQILPQVDYPIVPPMSASFSDGELDWMVPAPTSLPPEAEVVPPAAEPTAPSIDAAKMFLIWGSAGVLLGAFVTMGVTALSFRSYKRTGSVLRPALWAGGSAVVTGFLLLLAMRRALTAPSKSSAQWLAFATGANAST